MVPGNMITSFRGENAFLSNMFDVPISYKGYTFINAESAFQSQKQPDIADQFVGLSGPEAKRKGCKVHIRPDWDSAKDEIMLEVLRAKFLNKDMRSRLLNTGDAYIVEGNGYHDNYWGYCTCSNCALKDKHNKLGIMLMKIRDECKMGERNESN